MEQIVLASKELCTGCQACYSICPKQAIEMKINREGFYYPKIDEDKCINCGICQKVCPEINKSVSEYPISDSVFPDVYAAYNNDNSVRISSSSGGIYSVLAKYVISKGGVVFGAGYSKQFLIEHSMITAEEEIGKFRTSKYVQSYIGETFKLCKEELDKGVFVLFTGTSCQIAGLLNYLGKNYEKLITVDLICSGCTSPILWDKYLRLLSGKYGAEIKRVNFRDKYYGWNMFSLCVEFDNGKVYRRIFPNDEWVRLFLDAEGMRECCYSCKYKNYIHAADFTLGDFWGVQYEFPELFDDKGLSFVLLQSDKAKRIWENLKDINAKKIDAHLVEKRNNAISKSALRPSNREEFWKDYQSLDYEKLLKKYCHIPIWKQNNLIYLKYWGVRLKVGKLYRFIKNKLQIVPQKVDKGNF